MLQDPGTQQDEFEAVNNRILVDYELIWEAWECKTALSLDFGTPLILDHSEKSRVRADLAAQSVFTESQSGPGLIFGGSLV